MGLFKRLFSSQVRRTGIVIGLMVILIATVITFISVEIGHNRQLTISNYSTMQQKITNLASKNIENSIRSNQTDMNNAIINIINQLETSGNSYWFVARNQKLIFVKNTAATKLFDYITLNEFLEENKADGLQITSSSFTAYNYQYTVGNCTQTSYIEVRGDLFKHQIYIIMPLVLISLLFFVLFVFGITKINQLDNKIINLGREAMERNLTIEKLSAKIHKSRLNELGDGLRQQNSNKETTIYNKDILASLLDKLSKEKVIPLSIAIIEFKKGSKIQSNDFQDIFKTVSEVLTKEHVLAEVMPGVYAILLFHVSCDEINSIKDNLLDKWILPLEKQNIMVRIGFSCIESHDADVKSIFDTVLTEVSERRKNTDVN